MAEKKPGVATVLKGWQWRDDRTLGKLIIAPVDFAIDASWLKAAGVSLLWMCLGKDTAFFNQISEQVMDVARAASLRTVEWSASVPSWAQTPEHEAFESIWRELDGGGGVLAFCIRSRHRSVASTYCWLKCCLGLTHDSCLAILRQHPLQRWSDISFRAPLESRAPRKL